MPSPVWTVSSDTQVFRVVMTSRSDSMQAGEGYLDPSHGRGRGAVPVPQMAADLEENRNEYDNDTYLFTPCFVIQIYDNSSDRI